MSESNEIVSEPGVDNQVFVPALLAVLVCALPLIFFKDTAAAYAEAGMAFITTKLGWLYLLLGIAVLGFSSWLAFGRYGHVKLGEADEAPEYSTPHWVAMMFTTGIGASLIAWGFAEPIYYLQTPPFGIEPRSSQAIEFAHMYPMFHWGIIPWVIYAIPAIPIAYVLYVKREPLLRVSSACEGALPKKHRNLIKGLIDLLVIIGLIGATTTSLGFGVPLLAAFVSELLGVENSNIVKIGVLAFWTVMFGASVYRGLKKGIKVLADINMVMAGIAMVFILVAGPTLLILNLSVNSLGLIADNFAKAALWTDPIDKSGFPEAWTMFYWAWWLAYAGLVGLFFARISRGRTIRQVIVGVVCWGTLGTWLFLAIAGGYSLNLEINDLMPLSKILASDGMYVMVAQIIAAMPLGKFTLLVFTILGLIFYATTIDSAAYVMASVCAKDLHSDQEPKRSSRVIWAVLIALMTLGVIATGSLDAVKSAVVLSSVPLIPILVLMCISVVIWLRRDFGHFAGEKHLALDTNQITSND